MTEPRIAAPKPVATQWDMPRPSQGIADWTPEMGHVRGAAYEWGWADDQPLNTRKPTWQDAPLVGLPTASGSGPPAPKYQPPGVPNAFNMESVLGNGATDFMMNGAGAVAMGAAPGEQKGGYIEGPMGIPIATLPLNISNAPMYFREALTALVTGAAGMETTQNPDGSQGSDSGIAELDNVIDGIAGVGKSAMDGMDAIGNMVRVSNASVRIANVANLYGTGYATPTLIDQVTSFFAGGVGAPGAGKFNREDLIATAEARGVDPDAMIAEFYDLPLSMVLTIKANPMKYVLPVGGLALTGPGTGAWDLGAGEDGRGVAYSVNPLTNMAVEMGHMGLQIAALWGAGGALAAGGKAAAGAGQLTGNFARGAMLGSRVAGGIVKASSFNNAAGLGIRGTEWTVKQAAVMFGNKWLADQMDAMLWQQPLSNSPGLNLIGSLASHPIETAKSIRKGRLPIGRKGTAGEVGEVNLRRGGITRFDNPDAYVVIGGRPLTVIPSVREAIGTLRGMDLDGVQKAFLDEVGFDPALVRNVAGEGSKLNLTTDDLKSGIFYVYLEAARMKAGASALLIQGVNNTERSTNFFRQYAGEVRDMMKSDLNGETHYFRDAMRSQFWNQVTARSDSQMAGVKANLGPYDPLVSLAEFSSWLRASKTVNGAFADRVMRFESAPRHRPDVNVPYITEWRAKTLAKYDPNATVSLRDLNLLKTGAGFIERRGLGRLLVRKNNRPLTRVQVEEILASVEEAWAREQAGGVTGLFTADEVQAQVAQRRMAQEEAAARGEPVADDGTVFGPPTEDAAARVTGVTVTSVKLLNEVRKMDDAQKGERALPDDLLEWYVRWERPLQGGAADVLAVADRAATWKEVTKAWDDRMRDLSQRSYASYQFSQFGTLVEQRVAAGDMSPEMGAAVLAAVPDIVAALESPVGRRESYVQTVGQDTHIRGNETENAWMLAHPGVAAREASAQEWALQIANEIANSDEMVFAAGATSTFREVAKGDMMRAYPRDMSPSDIDLVDALIIRAQADPGAHLGGPELMDPDLHPLAKLGAVADVLGENMTPEETALVGQNRGFSRGVMEGADRDLASYRRKIETLAGQVSIVASRLSLEPFGGWSEPFRARHDTFVTLQRTGRVADGTLTPEDFLTPEQAIQQAYDRGDVETGQALNVAEGVARGGTAESGGAVRGPVKPEGFDERASARADGQARWAETPGVAPRGAPGISPDAPGVNAPNPDPSTWDAATYLRARIASDKQALRGASPAGMSNADRAEIPRIEQRIADMEADLRYVQESSIAPPAAVPEAGPVAPETPAAPIFVSPEVTSLYSRYMTGADGHVPASVGEVMGVMESLDLGIPGPLPEGATLMTLQEVATLRGALDTWLDDWMTRRAGAESGPVERTPGEYIGPAEMYDEVRQVLYALPRIVLDDPDALPLRGWEGTQYDFGPIPDDPNLPPRLIFEDFLDKADDVIPGLADELLMKRRQRWGPRMDDAMIATSMRDRLPLMARLSRFVDTAVGARNERTVVHQAIDRFVDELVGTHPEWTLEQLDQARAHARGIIGYWDEQMSKETTGIGRLAVQKYRKRSAVEGQTLQRWANEIGGTQEWYQGFLDANKGVENPVAQAWLRADNRVRAYFAGQDGGLARMIDTMYESRPARSLSGAQRSLSFWYNTLRFNLDVRWLGLNATEAFVLTASKEGFEPILNRWGWFHDAKGRLKKGTPAKTKEGLIAEAIPYGFTSDTLETLRNNWPWWLQQAESGMNLGRQRYVLANVKSLQDARLPGILLDLARKDPQIADLLTHLGVTPRDWLRELSNGWDIATGPLKNQKVLNPSEATAVYQPLLRKGVISQMEFDEAVATGRYTPNPELQRAIDAVTDPRMLPIMERLSFLTDQFWADSARLHFGQMDRSNMQRMMNHPLLYWPTSYMVNAAHWLGGILFDRALGHDTGMAGAWTLAQVHQKHVENWEDPEYRKVFEDHPTLLFLAEMVIPLTPYGMGVSLSPMTRGMIAMGSEILTGEPHDYTRNVMDWGPIQTTQSMLPRAISEEAKAAPEGSMQRRVLEAFENTWPVKFTVKKSSSRQSQAEQQAAEGQPAVPDTTPYQPRPQ